MKKIKYTFMLKSIAVIFAVVALSSCKKALELDPITDYAVDKYFESTKQADALLSGGYRRLQIATRQSFIYYGEGRTDNVEQNTRGSASTNTLSVLNNTLSGNLSYSRWDDYYDVIKQANLLIRNVPLMRERKVDISDADYNRILGQAYGLRALAYFYVVRVWGDAPLVTEPYGSVTDLDVLKTPRVDKNIIYNLISADLKKALICPSSNGTNETNRGKITRGAVYAMQTDYYMWRNMPDSALISSAFLLKDNGTPQSSNYKLVELANSSANYTFGNTTIDESPYSKMFTQGLSDESIFEVVFSFDEDNTSNIFGIYGNNNAQFNANKEFASSFDNDLRAIVAFKNDNQIYKFFPKGTFDQSKENDKNVIIYRLADIMLLRAEALNTLNRRDEAFVLVNLVRKRAGADQFTSLAYNSLSTRDAEDEILRERRLELCFEGKRWFDLVRTGRVPNGITEPNIVWPISFDVIRENPLIKQNEFYK